MSCKTPALAIQTWGQLVDCNFKPLFPVVIYILASILGSEKRPMITLLPCTCAYKCWPARYWLTAVTRIYQDIPGYTRIYQDIPGYTREPIPKDTLYGTQGSALSMLVCLAQYNLPHQFLRTVLAGEYIANRKKDTCV